MIHYFLEKLVRGDSIESAVKEMEDKLSSIKDERYRRWLEMEILKLDDHFSTVYPAQYGISIEPGDFSDFADSDLNNNRYIIIFKSLRNLREGILKRHLGGFGKNNFIFAPFSFMCGENIFLGNNVNIGRDSFIQALPNQKVIIEDNCLIGASSIITAVYHSKREYAQIYNQNISGNDVIIKSGVWLAANVKVLPGVTINEGAVIGAGAVVTMDIPPYAVAAGIPAKVIKYRE